MLQLDATVTKELLLYLHMCDITTPLIIDSLNAASVILPFDCGCSTGASSLHPTSWNPSHSFVFLLTSNAPLRTQMLQILTHCLFLWLCVYVCIKASLCHFFNPCLSASACVYHS